MLIRDRMGGMGFFKSRWVIAGVALALGFLAGALPSPLHSHVKNPFQEVSQWELDHSYRFINPLLACGEGEFNHLGNDETKQLEEMISSLTDRLKSEGKITDAGIYFRQLKGGPWMGVNYDTKFGPGSLLKVPLAMSVFESAETKPELLGEQVYFEGGDSGVQEYFTSDTIRTGSTYTVLELVRAALVHSDNNAALLLAQVVGNNRLLESYSQLGIDMPTFGKDYVTTVRNYASFFRVLYNGTYLSHEYSEQLLTILSESTFNKGIVAGVPKGTPVAHKFGERALVGESSVQLHDCGIIYKPENPYLLCVMMRGNDFNTIASAIAEVSRTVSEHLK